MQLVKIQFAICNTNYQLLSIQYNGHWKGKNNLQQDSEDDGDMEDRAFLMLTDEMIYMEVARRGYAMGIVQPIATLLAYGFRRFIIPLCLLLQIFQTMNVCRPI